MTLRAGPAAASALALSAMATGALAQDSDLSGDISIWSWNIAAAALEAVVPLFNEQYPDVNVTVEDLGNQQVFDRMLAGCAAGGSGLPDIVSIENHEAEIFWAQFPDCFVDMTELGYDDATAALFPDFKLTELEVDGKRYAMPWDSGPVAVFYRRDFYENAGIDPESIVTWDDFIDAGLKIQEANPGVTMTNADLNGDTEWVRMIGNEQGCGFFSDDGEAITVNQPGCVTALETLKKMVDAGIVAAAGWDEKIQSNNAGSVATQMYGGWYEGTVRTTAPAEQSGLWGVYIMPTVAEGGARAANLGGSSLAITSATDNAEAAYAYVKTALATDAGQIIMLKEQGLVPSLLTATEDPFTSEGLEFWGGQEVWQTILGTLGRVNPIRGTPFFGDADAIVETVQVEYLNGEYDSAQAALDEAARQIELVTGLPIAE